MSERESVSTVVVAKRLASAIVAAVAPKLFGPPCKLITTFKSSNISRRSSLPREKERGVGGESGEKRWWLKAGFGVWWGKCRQRVRSGGESERTSGVAAAGAFARGNFRSYKKSYRTPPFFLPSLIPVLLFYCRRHRRPPPPLSPLPLQPPFPPVFASSFFVSLGFFFYEHFLLSFTLL